MKPYTAINPVFHDTIQITETSDSAHADNINAAPKVLLENTLSNRQAIEELKTSTGSTEESEYSAVSAYQPGDYCIYNNELYRCIAAIVQGEQWNAQHWVKTTIANELLLLNKKEIEVVDPMTTTIAGFAADALKTKEAIAPLQTKMASFEQAKGTIAGSALAAALGITASTAFATIASKLAGVANRGALNWSGSNTTYTVSAGYYSGGTLNSKTSYTNGYNAGVTAADARVNTSSANYKGGYNAGYNAGKAAAEAKYPKTQTGTYTATQSAQSSQSYTVNFPTAFASIPSVSASCISTTYAKPPGGVNIYPGASIGDPAFGKSTVSVTSVTKAYFVLYVTSYRTNSGDNQNYTNTITWSATTG